ncbi:regulatory protein [Clostridium sp. USBA 49]|jgi:regulatory protein|uniref:recombination regulator RecX n=1 Tax=Clostridium sp. USBA 49 TaxID=1881060 RepID=UPI000998FEC8|nr:recombination regulator RecX [Clostridium sp. USBA 49]SKA72901.1 regulatory protein [Clostridium sp. USBA 49]
MENTITKIEIQKRNKNRVNIFIDKDFAFACSTELVFTYGLKENKVIESEKLLQIVDEDNYLKCKETALKIVEKSYKTEKEMINKLKLKGYDDKTIDKVINFLINYNFLNDENYVEMYIKDKIKTEGKNKIRYSLLKKGISEEIIENKINDIDTYLEMDNALKLAEKKYKTLIKTEKDTKKIYKKLGDFLLRKGYTFEETKQILNKVVVTKDFEEY